MRRGTNLSLSFTSSKKARNIGLSSLAKALRTEILHLDESVSQLVLAGNREFGYPAVVDL